MAAKTPETEPTPLFPGSFRYTPLQALRELFIGFLHGLFNGAPKGAYHWEESDDTTEIFIRDEATVAEETLGGRPLITIVRGPIQFHSLGLDDMLKYEADIDKKTKTVLVPGTMTLNCCSRVSLESEQIAWVVMEHIWILREKLIGNQLLFDTGQRPQMGSPSPAGSIIADGKGKEWICTPVSFPFQMYRTSSFTPLGLQIVRSIENHIDSRLYRMRNLGPPAITHEVPVGIHECPPPPVTAASDERGMSPDPGGRRQYFLPKQPHPLNPAKTVTVRTVRPFRPGLRPFVGVRPGAVPIPDPCVKESEST